MEYQRPIMVAEQQLARLEMMLRRSAQDQRMARHQRILQRDIEKQRQEIAKLKKIAGKEGQAVSRSHATQYVSSDPKQKTGSDKLAWKRKKSRH